ncbi:hypothetical protein BH20ACT18_BH20ACT18_04520 [soil metagenome]
MDGPATSKPARAPARPDPVDQRRALGGLCRRARRGRRLAHAVLARARAPSRRRRARPRPAREPDAGGSRRRALAWRWPVGAGGGRGAQRRGSRPRAPRPRRERKGRRQAEGWREARAWAEEKQGREEGPWRKGAGARGPRREAKAWRAKRRGEEKGRRLKRRRWWGRFRRKRRRRRRRRLKLRRPRFGRLRQAAPCDFLTRPRISPEPAGPTAAPRRRRVSPGLSTLSGSVALERCGDSTAMSDDATASVRGPRSHAAARPTGTQSA